MAESKVRDDNFFLVSGWMLNRLNLKGVALQVFSIIYGFSQDGEGSFTGSLQYLCDFTNASKNTVLKALKELVEKGYIAKTENTINGVRFCTYKTAPGVQNLNQGGAETEPGGGSKTAPGGGAKTEPNKEDINNIPSISKEIVNIFHTICVSFPKVLKVSPARQEAINKCLGKYSKEDIKTVFENAENSSFLKGNNDRGWAANFDWLIAERNFVKVLEGNYQDRGRKEPVPGWMKKDRELDEDELAAIDRMFADEPLADRAEKLRQRLQA